MTCIVTFSYPLPPREEDLSPRLVENGIAVSDGLVILFMSGTAHGFHESYSSKLLEIKLEYTFLGGYVSILRPADYFNTF